MHRDSSFSLSLEPIKARNSHQFNNAYPPLCLAGNEFSSLFSVPIPIPSFQRLDLSSKRLSAAFKPGAVQTFLERLRSTYTTFAADSVNRQRLHSSLFFRSAKRRLKRPQQRPRTRWIATASRPHRVSKSIRCRIRCSKLPPRLATPRMATTQYETCVPTRQEATRREINNTPDRNRTCNLPLRRRLLYPVELRGHVTPFIKRSRHRIRQRRYGKKA